MHPFTDADFVMDCILAAVDVICPEQHDDFKAIPLSALTVTRRVEDLASDVRSSMATNFKTFDVFSIALDETCDIKDTALLAIFVRGVKDNLEVVMEFLRLIPMKERTTGQDVLNALLPALSGFDLSSLVSVTTDGAPAMVGSTKGLSQLLIDHCRSLGCAQEIRMVHCIVHQEALCAKAAGIKDIMSVVVKLVNTVLARPLNHRIFKQMCEAAEADYGDLLYHTEVRWLSRGNVLKRVFALRHEIVSFVSERGLKDFQEFSEEVWLCRFGFLTDISSHLNELNLKLQGRDVLITNMEPHVRAFEVKLKLWEKQLCKRDYVHFPHLALCDAGLVDTEECVSVLLTLQNEFSSRFTDVRSHSQEFKFVSTPFDFPYDDAPSDVQLELIELQASDVLLSKFTSTTLLYFYRQLPHAQFPMLLARAKRVIAMFGSTYSCAQLFSKMKYCKNKLRSQLTDEHLNDILLLNSSSLEPDIVSVSKQMQHHVSH